VDRSDPSAREERLFEVLLDYLESSEHGRPPDSAEWLARHPEFAPELREFLDTHSRLENLTEPVRSMSRILRETVHSVPSPPPENAPTLVGNGSEHAKAAPDAVTAGGQGGPAPAPPPGNGPGWWRGGRALLSLEDLPFQAPPGNQGEIGRLASYRLLEIVGSGGMGIVFRGEDVLLQRPAAVKVLRPELATETGARQRFLREARLAASLTHENVVTVYQVGEEGGVAFLAMQWLSGLTLEEILRRAGGPLELADILRLARQTALGLAAAHGRGFLHRDMKPANLWVELPGHALPAGGAWRAALAAGRIKILDFGLAREPSDDAHLTRSGFWVGTPAYMAPEQAGGGPVDARSDLFSLGVILYRMCTGRLPFPARAPGSAAVQTPDGRPRPVRELNPAVPPELDALVSGLLSPDPAGRPGSAAELAESLAALEGRPTPVAALARTPVRAPAPTPAARGNGRRWGLSAAVALAALLPLAYLFGGVLVRFATNRGEVVIEVDDPDANVSVKAGGAVIEDRKGRRSITLAAGEQDLEVTVRDAGGESHFFTKKFVLRRGGAEIINVREELVAAAAASHKGTPVGPGAAKPAEGAVVDGDRRAAERVLSLGGKATVREAGREREVRQEMTLPAGDFRLVSADLAKTAVADADLALLGGLRELKELRLTDTGVGDRGVARLSELMGLRSLSLNGTQVTDAGLVYLRPLTELRELDLSRTAVGDAGLVHLEPLKNLLSLNLYATQFTEAGLAHVGSLTKLQSLCLSDMRVTDAGLAHLRPLTELRLLHLNGARISDAGLAHLAGMKKLASLNLPGTPVTDDGLVHLQELTGLEELALDSTKITDAGLPRLGALKKLRAVNLGSAGVTDAGMPAVGALTNLQELGLFRSRVTDAGLAHLEGLTKLQVLNLWGLPVSDAGLAHLARATGLGRLEIGHTRVNDKSIKAIISHSWPLHYLGLKETRISAKAYSRIKASYPKAEIPWSEPNRTVAEAVLAAGGTVWVRPEGANEERPVKAAGDLPAEHFMVKRYQLQRHGKVPEDMLGKLSSLTDPQYDGLEGADFTGGPCDLARLKTLLPKTVVDLTLDDAGIGDADLAHLQGFGLRRLSLEGCSVGGPGLERLKSAGGPGETLAELSLARTQVGDAQLGNLRAFPKLRRLDLSGCPVRGPGLTVLKDLPELREVILACPTLTDLFAEELSELKQVERLSLAGSGLTDEGLKHLRGLPKLRHLDLTATKITAAAAAALQKELPGCSVRSGPAGER
jgi:serine/threonine protein kinase/Leucine-rich repeat (LRR) protein